MHSHTLPILGPTKDVNSDGEMYIGISNKHVFSHEKITFTNIDLYYTRPTINVFHLVFYI